MTFDPWQLLVNFGTKPLDENERIFESSNADINALIQSGTLVYGRVTPHLYAAFDRGFYFQPVLVECNFANYLESLTQEPSLVSLDGIKGLKQLKNLNDEPYSLPFFPFYILVNRRLFGPQRPREDENTWLNNLTERRRAIAHELLYARQYAEFYDNETDSMTQSVSTPTSSEEDELMCPMDVIEKALNTFEVEQGVHFLTPGNFVDADPHILETYFRGWLRDFAVSKRVCEEQTINYLRNGVRNHVRSNVSELKRRISDIINEPDPKSKHLHSCLQNGHPHAAALTALCSEIGNQFEVSNSIVVVAIAHALDFKNGAGV